MKVINIHASIRLCLERMMCYPRLNCKRHTALALVLQNAWTFSVSDVYFLVQPPYGIRTTHIRLAHLTNNRAGNRTHPIHPYIFHTSLPNTTHAIGKSWHALLVFDRWQA